MSQHLPEDDLLARGQDDTETEDEEGSNEQQERLGTAHDSIGTAQ